MHEFKTKRFPFSRGFLSCEGGSKLKRMSAGFLTAMKELPLSAFNVDEQGFCRGVALGEVYFAFANSLVFRPGSVKGSSQNGDVDPEDEKYILENMPSWASNSYERTPEYEMHETEGHMWAGSWMGHANPDFAGFAANGTDYYREKVAKYRAINEGKDDFYDAMDMMLDAFDVMCARYGEKAAQLMEACTDEKTKAYYARTVKTFDHAPKKPCRDFAEASILFILNMCFDGQDSPGHFDQYMYPFWEKTDEPLRREYLHMVWRKLIEADAWNLCISGSDAEGNDLTNSLTYAILEETAAANATKPNLTLRWHKGTPKELMEAAHKALATGCGLPALYNDEVVCPALESLGIPASDAHEYVMNGCNQIDIQSKSHMGLEDGQVCLAKAVELALNNGVSTVTGNVLGPKTGTIESFKTFEDFYSAFIIQAQHLLDVTTGLANLAQRTYAEKSPNPYRSILIEGCIEKAKDYKNGGPLYGHGQILFHGIAETADSLAAIKKYVFEEKKYTLQEIADMAAKNFEGHEEDFRFFANNELKFGNDIEYVDELAEKAINHCSRYLRTIPTFRGGFFTSGCSPFINSPGMGRALGALPSGRKCSDPIIADSIGATPGRDTNGPTALLNSCLHLDQTLPASGFILNLKFDKNIFNSEPGKEAFLSLWESYFERGGQQIQIGVVSQEELLDAQKNPDAHRDLIVRVGGYSDRFVNLNEDLQNNVIARTMY